MYLVALEAAADLDLRAEPKVYRRTMNTMQISQLAERTGIPATTLRFYETTGCYPPDEPQQATEFTARTPWTG